MSMFGPGAHIGSPLPQGQLIGNYRSYEAAIAAVDRAVEAGVDPRFLSIVGRDLRSVYRLRHRPSYAAVAGRAALQGAFFGMFIGLLFSMMTGGQDLMMTLGSTVLLGAVIWVLFGVIGEVMRRRQLKYAMIPSMTAVSYDLVVDNSVASQVNAALGPQPMGQANQPAEPVAPTQPEPHEPAQQSEPSESEPSGGIPDLPDGRPQYGVRVDPKPPADQPQDSDDSETR
ncbi:MAG TPA: general stress protein [Enteractinococcus sp.]